VLPLALAALAGGAALTATSAVGMGAAGQPAAVALALGGALLWAALALAVPRLRDVSPRGRRLLDRLETAVNLALVPLVFAALGVFDIAVDLARRFS
jgi:hypothetical protein